MAFNLGPLFQSFGDAGSQFGSAQIAAARERVNRILDQLGIQQGQVGLQEANERLRRLKGEPANETEKWQQINDAFKKFFGRDPTDEEKKLLFGTAPLTPPKTPKDQLQEKLDLLRTNGIPITPDIVKRLAGVETKEGTAGPKFTKTKTYDPSGQLREAWENPQTGEVEAWGSIVPENEAIEKWTDEQGNIHVLKMDRSKKVNPGEIRMTEKAQQQWESIHQSQPSIGKPTVGMGKGGKANPPQTGGGGTIIGTTTPKYSAPLTAKLKDAGDKYNTWLGAMKNSQYKTPKTDLAIVFAAVRAQVQGAGRMTNVELDRELKAGSFGQRFERQADMAISGTLPDDQRQDLLTVVRNSWMASAETARSQWKTDIPDKPMPTYIQGEDVNPSPAGANAPPPGARVRDYTTLGPH